VEILLRRHKSLRGAKCMLTKQGIVKLMVNNPDLTGRCFFRVGDRVIFTASEKTVDKKRIQHTSYLMPAEVPVVSEPSREEWYFDRVAEEIAEKKIIHTMRGHWQKKVAKAFGLDPEQVALEGYKVVAVKDNRFLSIYDGKTEYKLGERLDQTAKRDHQGGYYVLKDSFDLDVNIRFPTDAVLWYWPHRAILKVQYGGKIVRYKNKVAASWIRPLYVVRTF